MMQALGHLKRCPNTSIMLENRREKMSAGIDYGAGMTNIDHANGIRYGAISQNSVLQAWADSAEAEYGPPTCPKCGNEAKEFDRMNAPDDHYDYAEHECVDYQCDSCRYVFGSDSAFGDTPIGWSYNGDGYELVDCLDSDILVIRSPFYTLACFCSPCVPGAGDLNSPSDDGAKTYCLDHDWFEDGKATYSVYRVDTDEIVEPKPSE